MAIYKATPGDSSLVKGAKNTSTLLVAKATQVKTQKVSVAQNLSNLLIAKAVGSALSKVNHLAYITLTQGLHYYSDFLSSIDSSSLFINKAVDDTLEAVSAADFVFNVFTKGKILYDTVSSLDYAKFLVTTHRTFVEAQPTTDRKFLLTNKAFNYDSVASSD